MSNKKTVDLETFVETINKKTDKHNGKRIRFGWSKRKKK